MSIKQFAEQEARRAKLAQSRELTIRERTEWLDAHTNALYYAKHAIASCELSTPEDDGGAPIPENEILLRTGFDVYSESRAAEVAAQARLTYSFEQGTFLVAAYELVVRTPDVTAVYAKLEATHDPTEPIAYPGDIEPTAWSADRDGEVAHMFQKFSGAS